MVCGLLHQRADVAAPKGHNIRPYRWIQYPEGLLNAYYYEVSELITWDLIESINTPKGYYLSITDGAPFEYAPKCK